MLITIFTPTFNRSNLLQDLYQSLMGQTSKNFEWLIVDDGSTDDTAQVIKKFTEQNLLDIRYVRTENGGKHRAINFASEYARGEYIFIVDNDDMLIPEAIDIAENYLKYLDPNLAGVVFRLKYKDNRLVGQKLPFEEKVLSYFDVRYKMGYNVDFKEFTRVSILKQYKYPEYDNERFCSEALVWNRISEKYDFLFVDKAIYICEYLEQGLSDNIVKNRRNSSSYAMDIYKELFDSKKVPLKIKIKSILNYWRFGFFNAASFFSKWRSLNHNFFALLLYPLALVLVVKDNYIINKKK